jgi:CheY-like chemotaxis protein
MALTAHEISGDREHCFAAGSDLWASKPIDLQALTHSCINRREAMPSRPASAG